MKKEETPEHIEKRHLREQKELLRRKKDLARPLPKLYLYYLFLIVGLAYIVDEIASNIANQFQSNIVNDFFVSNMGMEYAPGLSLYQTIGFVASIPLLLVILYKPLADKWGRKSSAIVMTSVAIVAYALFFTGSLVKFPPMAMGFLIGAFVGAYWSAGDTIDSIMIGESAPTNLRNSCTTVEAIVFFVAGLVGEGIAMLCQLFTSERYLGLLYFLLVIPGLSVALFLLIKNVGETKGMNFDTVTGEEWEEPKSLQKEK